jgi:hypothetical protein
VFGSKYGVSKAFPFKEEEDENIKDYKTHHRSKHENDIESPRKRRSKKDKSFTVRSKNPDISPLPTASTTVITTTTTIPLESNSPFISPLPSALLPHPSFHSSSFSSSSSSNLQSSFPSNISFSSSPQLALRNQFERGNEHKDTERKLKDDQSEFNISTKRKHKHKEKSLIRNESTDGNTSYFPQLQSSGSINTISAFSDINDPVTATSIYTSNSEQSMSNHDKIFPENKTELQIISNPPSNLLSQQTDFLYPQSSPFSDNNYPTSPQKMIPPLINRSLFIPPPKSSLFIYIFLLLFMSFSFILQKILHPVHLLAN